SPSSRLPSSHSSLPITIPSPQILAQTEPLQSYSSPQLSEHPSPGMTLRSSQASVPSISPSPQTVAVHTLGEPPQENPGSRWQCESQPSPLTLSPSSHCSPSSTLPLAQPSGWKQAAPGTGQSQPSVISRQTASQPSPLSVLPSSQTSPGSRS